MLTLHIHIPSALEPSCGSQRAALDGSASGLRRGRTFAACDKGPNDIPAMRKRVAPLSPYRGRIRPSSMWADRDGTRQFHFNDKRSANADHRPAEAATTATTAQVAFKRTSRQFDPLPEEPDGATPSGESVDRLPGLVDSSTEFPDRPDSPDVTTRLVREHNK